MMLLMSSTFIVYQYYTIKFHDNGMKNGNDGSTTTSTVTLHPICCSLNEISETVLRNQLLRRITNGHNQTEGGGVFSAQLPAYESNCGIYFYVILSGESGREHDYIGCIVHEKKEVLDSFSSELDQFLVNHVKPLLLKPSEGELTEKMRSWESYTTKKLLRGVLCLREIMSDVLTVTFINGKLHLSSLPEEDAQCIREVIDIASVFRRPDDRFILTEKTFELIQDPKGNCIIAESQRPLNGEVSYFEPTAKEIVGAADESDVVKIKQIVHNFHVKTAHDLNNVKRLVDQAKNDYYSLFRLHIFLERNRSQHMSLFQCFLKMDAFNEEEKTILSLLRDFSLESHPTAMS